MSKPLSECLTQAADLIEEEEWVQSAFRIPMRGTPEFGSVQYCMIGACREVCPPEPGSKVACNDPDFAKALGFSEPDAAYTYNDRRNRTRKQVLSRMRKYAEIQARKEARAK